MEVMKRILEPEIMDDETQAIAYAEADFSSSNQIFVDKLIEDYSDRLNRVLDIGCGPADVPIRLARAKPAVRITAVDASDPMIRLARKAVKDAGLEEHVTVIKGRVPGLSLENHNFDAIASKDLLHHLPDPMVFWAELKRLAKPETVVYVMDLLRPQTREQAKEIVELVSGREAPILKQDFYNSLLAAFTLDEIKDQLRRAAVALEVARIGERHLLVKGLMRGTYCKRTVP
jgi:ubiquinone/menaquinone biosynthesis C-methylase UbiE